MQYKSIISNNNYGCNKINLDKYYTPVETANYCINKTFDILKDYNISDIIEPSAGNGSFSNILMKNYNTIALDIEPENNIIEKRDFLTLNIPYKSNRLIIGNPPYGSRLNLAKKFYEKAIELGDFISFILPISQFNSNSTMYKFDLIYSEDLGLIDFGENKKIHCCLNIYSRPINKTLNKRPVFKLNDLTLIRQDQTAFETLVDYDIRICYLGNGTAGKILSENEHYCSEYKIIINNEKLRYDIINFLETVDWKSEIKSTAMLSISKSQFIKTIIKYIPNIK